VAEFAPGPRFFAIEMDFGVSTEGVGQEVIKTRHVFTAQNVD
jgi:hypothetical protein